MFDDFEFSPVAAVITCLLAGLLYYGMFVVDGVEGIRLADRVFSFVVAVPLGYFFADYLIKRG